MWPYELDKLSLVSEEYEAVGKADCRLGGGSVASESFGTAVLVQHQLVISLLIASVVSGSRLMMAFNQCCHWVYLPSLDQGMDYYPGASD